MTDCRVTIQDPEKATGLMKLCFDGGETLRGGPGKMPNSYRVGANVPFIQMMLVPFISVVAREGGGGKLTTKLKEMVVIKTSQVNGCAY